MTETSVYICYICKYIYICNVHPKRISHRKYVYSQPLGTVLFLKWIMLLILFKYVYNNLCGNNIFFMIRPALNSNATVVHYRNQNVNEFEAKGFLTFLINYKILNWLCSWKWVSLRFIRIQKSKANFASDINFKLCVFILQSLAVCAFVRLWTAYNVSISSILIFLRDYLNWISFGILHIMIRFNSALVCRLKPFELTLILRELLKTCYLFYPWTSQNTLQNTLFS